MKNEELNKHLCGDIKVDGGKYVNPLYQDKPKPDMKRFIQTVKSRFVQTIKSVKDKQTNTKN